jgi:hypothetical protein
VPASAGEAGVVELLEERREAGRHDRVEHDLCSAGHDPLDGTAVVGVVQRVVLLTDDRAPTGGDDRTNRAGVGEGVFDQLGAHLRATTGPDVGFVEAKDLIAVGGVDEVEGRSMVDVVSVQLRRLVTVRRAPGGVEQGDVVSVRELLRRRSGEFAETDREHGAAERVLEWLTGAEIGGDRERADHLGGPDRSPTGRPRYRDCSGILRRHSDNLSTLLRPVWFRAAGSFGSVSNSVHGGRANAGIRLTL